MESWKRLPPEPFRPSCCLSQETHRTAIDLMLKDTESDSFVIYSSNVSMCMYKEYIIWNSIFEYWQPFLSIPIFIATASIHLPLGFLANACTQQCTALQFAHECTKITKSKDRHMGKYLDGIWHNALFFFLLGVDQENCHAEAGMIAMRWLRPSDWHNSNLMGPVRWRGRPWTWKIQLLRCNGTHREDCASLLAPTVPLA